MLECSVTIQIMPNHGILLTIMAVKAEHNIEINSLQLTSLVLTWNVHEVIQTGLQRRESRLDHVCIIGVG